MTDHFTAFDDETRIATGPLAEVALAVKRAARDANASAILIFDDRTGRTIDLDLLYKQAALLHGTHRALHRPVESEPEQSSCTGRGTSL